MIGSKDKTDIRNLRVRMIATFVLTLFLGFYLLSSIIIRVSNVIISNKVSSLITANSRQIELNINNCLNTVESITTLMFADEKYYEYDPVARTYDEYSKIKNEERIADRIVDLGLMFNFTDFSVVYADGNRVGWTSNTTADLYDSEELYNVMSSAIRNSRTEDGWAFGMAGVTDRIYYVKRLNKNAVIMTSFYSRELETAFEYPSQLEGMVINLVDENNTILYSSMQNNIGKSLNSEIADIIAGNPSNDYIANVNHCENGWSVVCAIPSTVILRETKSLKKTVLMYSLFIAVFMAGFGFIIFSRMFKPVDTAVEELRKDAVRDKLTCLYNKQSFNDEVARRLASSDLGTTRTFVMIDVDNFKMINDTWGHDYGDDVIKRMGVLVSKQFKHDYVTGRVGGDEFALFKDNSIRSVDEEKKVTTEDIDALFASFNEEFKKEKETIPVSLSVGIAVLFAERRFENLYKAADEALYASKKAGKNRYTIYESKEVTE